MINERFYIQSVVWENDWEVVFFLHGKTCYFDVCIDTHGVLYRSKNETRKKAKDLAENDFYDSDEDVYFDRTGQIEKNRESRRKRALVSFLILFN